MASVGKVLRIPERQQDAVTAISGSGPAYIFFVVESMIEAGVHLGLPRTTATELVIQTLVGSAKMLRETGTHPTVLREQVTSPGGTTASALRELEIHKVRAAFLAAMEAARDRSRQLAEGELSLDDGCRSSGARAPRGRRATTRPTTCVPGALLLTRAISVARPGRADLALALPDRGRAVLLRLDRQPRPPQPATRSPRARTSSSSARPMAVVFRLDVVRRRPPVDGDHHAARPAAVRPGRDDVRRRARRARLPDRRAGWPRTPAARSPGPARTRWPGATW